MCIQIWPPLLSASPDVIYPSALSLSLPAPSVFPSRSLVLSLLSSPGQWLIPTAVHPTSASHHSSRSPFLTVAGIPEFLPRTPRHLIVLPGAVLKSKLDIAPSIFSVRDVGHSPFPPFRPPLLLPQPGLFPRIPSGSGDLFLRIPTVPFANT